MKYIRTKDRVFETNRLPIERFSIELTKIIDNQIGLPNPHIEEIEIIAQADTIEELCDEFVDTSELRGTNTGGWLYDELDSKNKCLVYYEHDKRKTISLNEFDDLSKIYGAIFTDKGLIYVAKMNDKGEMELI